MAASPVETIYLIHHSHTDIGYTHDQPVVWDLHRRFIDVALDLCERDAGSDEDSAFRWTVETTGVLQHWLRTSSDRQIARFVELARAGRIEVTAMFANITPLYDTDQLIESFAPLRAICYELGLPVRSAMNSDVNGQNWPLVDVLVDLGITGFSMSINTHFGGALEPHPLAFHWQGPSGRTILAWNGFSYGLARQLGIGRDARDFAERWWPRLDAWLAEVHYPLPVLMLQIFHPFGDNGSADPMLSVFVRDWNASGRQPRLRIALPHEWWEVVRRHAHRLPVLRGDWTDFWNFGCGSSAREVAINRESRARLLLADAAWAAVHALGGEPHSARQPAPETRERAHHALNLWDEHTWGADVSIRRPEDEDTIAQWYHKASYAYTARSLSLMLARDGVAELARRIERTPDDVLVVFNPLPWERIAAGPIPDPSPAAQRGRADDPTASRHFFDRARPRAMRLLAPVHVPAFGYTVVPSTGVVEATGTSSSEWIVETGLHRLTFDVEHGGITSWFARELGRELVDGSAGWPLHGFVHERVRGEGAPWPRHLLWSPPGEPIPPRRGWRPDWQAERRGPARVIEHRVERTPLGIRVVQQLEAPGVRNLVQEVFLPDYAAHIECSASWEMTQETAPEATYLAFPLAVPAARVFLDLGGQPIEPEADQLPGACRDYFTVQRWVAFCGQEDGVIVACPTTPMVQLGAFSFAQNRSRFRLERSLLLGWVTNNYWETNFRAHQPGRVWARYLLLPYRGPFSEALAHRFGAEATVPWQVQHLGEPPVAAPPLLPRAGTLLELPREPVLTLRIKPAASGRSVVLRLLNASDAPAAARIASALLRIEAAQRCDLLEQALEPLPVAGGAVTLDLPPRGLACLRLVLSETPPAR
jgi:alpha-mannosidase